MPFIALPTNWYKSWYVFWSIYKNCLNRAVRWIDRCAPVKKMCARKSDLVKYFKQEIGNNNRNIACPVKKITVRSKVMGSIPTSSSFLNWPGRRAGASTHACYFAMFRSVWVVQGLKQYWIPRRKKAYKNPVQNEPAWFFLEFPRKTKSPLPELCTPLRTQIARGIPTKLTHMTQFDSHDSIWLTWLDLTHMTQFTGFHVGKKRTKTQYKRSQPGFF